MKYTKSMLEAWTCSDMELRVTRAKGSILRNGKIISDARARIRARKLEVKQLEKELNSRKNS